MRIVEFIHNPAEQKRDELHKFVAYCAKTLSLEHGVPKIEFSNNEQMARTLRTMGFHDSEHNTIWVYIGNRNLADIMRTTAHELVHAKQREQGRLDNDPHAGTTGSEQENEANSMAGVIMRKYGQKNPHIFESQIR